MEFVVNEDSDVDKYLELIAGEEQVRLIMYLMRNFLNKKKFTVLYAQT